MEIRDTACGKCQLRMASAYDIPSLAERLCGNSACKRFTQLKHVKRRGDKEKSGGRRPCRCDSRIADKLFYSTGIPVSLWILNRNKSNNPSYRNRQNEVLFIDARKLGELIDRRHRELSNEDIKEISETYHKWRNAENEEKYQDITGFCKSVTIEEIKEHEYVLTLGRYAGIEEEEGDGIPFEEKMQNMTSELAELFSKSHHLEEEIRENLKKIGFEF